MRRKSAIVVGAGIVGLACSYHLVCEGLEVTLVDRDPTGDKASLGNAAGIAVAEVIPASVPGLIWKVPGWLLDPLGPLAIRPAYAPALIPWLLRFMKAGRPAEVERIGAALSALNRRVYDDLMPMLNAIGFERNIYRRGALTVYETKAAFERDATEWAFKRKHGIEVELLDGDGARKLEPALGPNVACGALTPQWSHISDPKALVDLLRTWLVEKFRVKIMSAEALRLAATSEHAAVTLGDGRMLSADAVVVAAGAWAAELAASLGDKVSLESERGYNTTIPSPGITLEREVIFAERKFVATPLSIGLRIGGAAEFGGLLAKPNYKRSEALTKLASLYFPALRTQGGKAWAGHRPTTPDSLPVIGASPRADNIFYAFGHGHLGLTQAATTGRLIADRICDKAPTVDLAPYSISRFD